MITLQLLNAKLLDVETDLIVVPIFNDLIPLKGEAGYLDWRLNGEISRLIKANKISGIFEEVTLISREHKIACGTALLLGFGKMANLDSPKLATIYSYMAQTIKSMGKDRFALSLSIPSSNAIDDCERLSAGLVEGLADSLIGDKSSGDYTIAVAEEDAALLKSLKKGLTKAIRARQLGRKMKIESG
ncbi:MAG: M17 family peptidase N-terminal domain-containing protein [Nitrospinota bacterium]|nr:hypothetical protein [Nitrospinota bacterium]